MIYRVQYLIPILLAVVLSACGPAEPGQASAVQPVDEKGEDTGAGSASQSDADDPDSSPPDDTSAGGESDAGAGAGPTPQPTPQATPEPASDADEGSSTDAATPTPTPTPSPAPTDADGSAPPAREFGQPNDRQIRPGVIVTAQGSQCTSNFIYSDAAGDYYLGAAAHCFSPDASTGADPCQARNLPLGTAVEIENAAFMGSLAYSSWAAMQQQGEVAGTEICVDNDFALIRIDPRDLDNVHPAAHVYGGPTALYEGRAPVGDRVYSYGQSPFHFGVESLQAKQGQISSQTPGGWRYTISTDNPGLSGDSGSAVLHESGRALGVLTTVGACVGLCPTVSNGVANLELALAYANTHVFADPLILVEWSQFSP